MEDYDPDRTPYWQHGDTAGTWQTTKMAGANVQIYGTISSSADAKQFKLEQWVTRKRYRFNGVADPTEGQRLDDIKKSGRDVSRPPFRQEWTDNKGVNISMADAPAAGHPLDGHQKDPNLEIDREFETSLTKGVASPTIYWSQSIRVENGKVTRNEIK